MNCPDEMTVNFSNLDNPPPPIGFELVLCCRGILEVLEAARTILCVSSRRLPRKGDRPSHYPVALVLGYPEDFRDTWAVQKMESGA